MSRWKLRLVALLLTVVMIPLQVHGAIFEMRNEDVIVGELSASLIIELAFGRKLEVPPKELVSLVEERFTFQDGSLLRGRIVQEAFVVKTRFGEMKLPSAELRTIKLAQETMLSAAGPGAEKVQQAAAAGPKTAAQTPPDKTVTNNIDMAFVLIPAGEFMMGSNDGYDDEKPIHKVVISRPFYLGKYEVTQGQWERIMGNNPSRFKDNSNRPVEQISWDQAQEFMRRLNARDGSAKYRLPTEAEWEYAAAPPQVSAPIMVEAE